MKSGMKYLRAVVYNVFNGSHLNINITLREQIELYNGEVLNSGLKI